MQKDITVGQNLGATANPYVFGPADQFGMHVAHEAFWRAAAEQPGVQAVDLFAQPRQFGLDQVFKVPMGDKVRVLPIQDLPREASRGNYVVINAGPNITQFSQIRLAHGLQFPICSVLHSIEMSTPFALPALLGTLLTCAPGDVMVATSGAGASVATQMRDRATALISQSGYGCPRELPIVKLPLFVSDEGHSRVERDLARSLLEIDRDELVLLYMGRVTDEYKADLDSLLVLGRELVKEFPRLSIVIAGHGAHDAYGRRLLRAAHLSGLDHPRVRLVPDFPRFTKDVIYGLADVFVSPVDNMQETFGLSLLEAMRAGLPTVVSDWSGYRDIVCHGETGFLVPTFTSAQVHPESVGLESAFLSHHLEYIMAQRTVVDCGALLHYTRVLLRDPQLRIGMGRNGQQRAKKMFNPQAILNEFLNLWRHQIEEAKGTPPRRWDIGFQEAVKIYASQQLQRSDLLGNTFGDVPELEELRRLSTNTPPEPMTWQEVQDVLRRCRESPVQVGELLRGDLELRISGIMWMLKKGLLQFIREPTGNHAALISRS